MISLEYRKAYTEVLEVIKNLSEDEYNKIPKSKIEFYEKNKDKFYNFKIDLRYPVEKQGLSKEANAILVSLFLDYFVTPRQKQELQSMLKNNDEL